MACKQFAGNRCKRYNLPELTRWFDGTPFSTNQMCTDDLKGTPPTSVSSSIFLPKIHIHNRAHKKLRTAR